MRPGQVLVGTCVAPPGSSRAQTLPRGTTLGRLTCLRHLCHRWKKSALGNTFQRVNRAGALGDPKCQRSAEVTISPKLKGQKSHTDSTLQWSLLLIYGKPQAVGLPVSIQGRLAHPSSSTRPSAPSPSRICAAQFRRTQRFRLVLNFRMFSSV